MKNVLALCTIPFTTFSIFLCRSFSSRSIIALPAFRTFSLLVRTLLAGLSFFSLRFQRLIRRAIISYFPATSVSPYVTWLTVSSGFFISSSRFMQIPPGYHERSLLPSLPFLPSLSTFRLAPYLRVCFFCYNSSLLLILLLRPTLPTPSLSHLYETPRCTHQPVFALFVSLVLLRSLLQPFLLSLCLSLSNTRRTLLVALTTRNQYIPLCRPSPPSTRDQPPRRHPNSYS